MSIYVKTSAGADLISTFHEFQDSNSTQKFNIGGKIDVVCGTKLFVTAPGRDWFKLFDKVELQEFFGPGLQIERIHVATFNADSTALNSHFYPPEIYYQGDWCVYQYYYPATASKIDVRVNYTLYYYY